MSADDGLGWYGASTKLGSRATASATERPPSERRDRPAWSALRSPRPEPATDGADRRAAYRVELAPGRAHVVLAGQVQAELGDISALGGRLASLSGTASFAGGHLPATIHLADEAPFRVDLRVVRTAVTATGALVPVGVCFDALAGDSLRSLCRFIVREYLDRDFDVSRFVQSSHAVRNQRRDTIAKIFLASAIRDQGRIQVFRGGNLLEAHIQVASLAMDRGVDVMVGFVRGDVTELGAGLDLTFMLPGRSSVFLFRAPVLECRQRRIVLPLPDELIQTGFRGSQRTPLVSGDTIGVSFAHPHLPDSTVQKEAVDLAARGLALSMEWDQDLLLPGDRLPGIRLTFPDDTTITASGTIRGLRRGPRGSVRCGIELLDFGSEREQRLWHRFVFQRMHPRLGVAATDDLDRVWDVYERSTYVEKWLPPGTAEGVRRDFKSAWAQLNPQSGRLLLINEDRTAVGTIAANQMYPRTWLMHGLAVDKAQRQQGGREKFLELTRELYSGIMYTLQHVAGCKYFLSYFQQGKAWNQRLYGDFARNYVSSSDQLYDDIHVLRRRTDEPLAPARRRPGTRIGRASAAERSLIGREAQRTLPALLADALSLNESELDLRDFSATIAGSGLLRGREVFLAREDDEPVFAAVCETAAGSLSIFGLMNICWTIPMRARVPAPETLAGLMAEVNRHYQSRSASEFLVVQDDRSGLSPLQSQGFQEVGPGIRWLARVDVLPAWLAYVEAELLAGAAS